MKSASDYDSSGYQMNPRRARPVQPRAFKDVVSSRNLLATFRDMAGRAGDGAGVDKVKMSHVSAREIAPILRKLSKSVLEGTYKPQPLRPVMIPKRRGGHRTLEIATVADRVLARALLYSFRDRVLEKTHPHFHGLVFDKSTDTLIDEIMSRAAEGQRLFVMERDIKDAYPSVPLGKAIEALDKRIDEKQIVALIETVLQVNAGSDARGIPQGSPLSPIALLTLLSDNLTWEETQDKPSSLCYVDNIVYLGDSADDVLAAADRHKSQLAELGMDFGRSATAPVELSKINERFTVLGQTLVSTRKGLIRQISKSAWNNLSEKLKSLSVLAHPDHEAITATEDWLGSYKPALVHGAKHTARRITQMCCDFGLYETGTRAHWEIRIKTIQPNADVLTEFKLPAYPTNTAGNILPTASTVSQSSATPATLSLPGDGGSEANPSGPPQPQPHRKNKRKRRRRRNPSQIADGAQREGQTVEVDDPIAVRIQQAKAVAQRQTLQAQVIELWLGLSEVRKAFLAEPTGDGMLAQHLESMLNALAGLVSHDELLGTLEQEFRSIEDERAVADRSYGLLLIRALRGASISECVAEFREPAVAPHWEFDVSADGTGNGHRFHDPLLDFAFGPDVIDRIPNWKLDTAQSATASRRAARVARATSPNGISLYDVAKFLYPEANESEVKKTANQLRNTRKFDNLKNVGTGVAGRNHHPVNDVLSVLTDNASSLGLPKFEAERFLAHFGSQTQ